MGRHWLIGGLALAWLAAPGAFAQQRPLPPATELLCSSLQTLERAALDDFYPVVGKARKTLKFLRLGPLRYDTTLVLPEADDCYIRSSGLKGRHDYYCIWHSEKPEFAAADYAKRIAACLNAELRQSDFTTNLVAVTGSKVSFSVGSDNKWSQDQIRLLVTAP